MSSADFTAYEAKCQAAKALAAEILPANKAALFDALAGVGVGTVVVTFDGYGDSGQIESITAFAAGEAEMELPATTIRLREVDFEKSTVTEVSRSVRDTIQAMAYAFLEEAHDGWEDQDGAFGEFIFSVADRSIRLEYNERYTETHYHEHEF